MFDYDICVNCGYIDVNTKKCENCNINVCITCKRAIGCKKCNPLTKSDEIHIDRFK